MGFIFSLFSNDILLILARIVSVEVPPPPHCKNTQITQIHHHHFTLTRFELNQSSSSEQHNRSACYCVKFGIDGPKVMQRHVYDVYDDIDDDDDDEDVNYVDDDVEDDNNVDGDDAENDDDGQNKHDMYLCITCLVQISTNEGGDFIIDTLALREHIHKLNLVFTDPKKLKVFHGAEMDVMWLQRDFGVYVVGLFDTHQAARALQAARLSLKYLLCKYCRVDADKKYQLADWRIRPLPDELVTYARMDTHYLLYIWRQMKEELLRKGGGPQLLLSVFEQSRQICGTTYNKTVVHENSHLSLYLRSKKSFNSQQMAALKMLYKWRDAQARALDEGTIYLLPNHMLLQLAETLPREVQGVSACCSPMPPFVKQNLIAIHRMLLSSRNFTPCPAGIHSVINSQPTSSVFQLHDFAHYKEYSDEQPVDLDRTAFILADLDKFQPDIQAFVPTYNTDSYCAIVSDLNVDAKQFVPPYDRYRKYRSLAQYRQQQKWMSSYSAQNDLHMNLYSVFLSIRKKMEEMREFRDKEAKITAIGKGDELIKTEVLNKLQQAKSQIEHDVKAAKEINGDINYEIIKLGSEEENGAKIRKRKMSAESEQLPRVKVLESKELKPNVKHKPEAKNDVKPTLSFFKVSLEKETVRKNRVAPVVAERRFTVQQTNVKPRGLSS
ncbi:hypothetical protein MSG28_001137 [Choristoneura fumiferana]|uniref:Uncharacterized protein n=1 Tax=Choristoneura fumiferana TaxID=7141 RepID=A0ACC0K4F4_CHOFU|nr:hypothetical protein MSG28_001137 [Choristoneura fumiferana]